MLIDLQRVDAPVRIDKCGRIVLDILLAVRCERGASRVSREDLTRPLSAKGNIEHDLLIHKMLIDVTAACELCCWQAPVLGVG